MRKALITTAVLLVFYAAQASAQTLHYDPFYILPGTAGSMGADAGLSTGDIGSIADASDVYLIGKYSVSGKLEAGTRVTFGILNDGTDSFQALQIGAKYGLSEKSAITLNLLAPLGGVDDPGLSMGYMQTMQVGGLDVNNHLQVGLLDGYAPKGVAIDLFIEPVKLFDDQLTGYLDILISSNTDAFGDNLAINLGPNLDYVLTKGLVLNVGITVGIAGDAQQKDVGLALTAIKTMSGK